MIYLPINDPLDYEVIPPLPLDLLSQPDFPQVDFVRLMTKVNSDNWPTEVSEINHRPFCRSNPRCMALVGRFTWLTGVWRSWMAGVRQSWIAQVTGNRQ
jgi:hypothetical protein